MAGGAALEAHRVVLECERTAFIAVAIETTGFVGGETLLHGGAYRTVRIVAIHAAHGVLRQLVAIGLLEFRPYVQMATGAFGVDSRGAARHQAHRPIGVNFVATDA